MATGASSFKVVAIVSCAAGCRVEAAGLLPLIRSSTAFVRGADFKAMLSSRDRCNKINSRGTNFLRGNLGTLSRSMSPILFQVEAQFFRSIVFRSLKNARYNGYAGLQWLLSILQGGNSPNGATSVPPMAVAVWSMTSIKATPPTGSRVEQLQVTGRKNGQCPT